MSYLKLTNFSVYQKEKHIVKNINFTAQKGEFIALLGLNGSGKTTLIKGICGLLKTSGECCIGEISNLNTKNKTMQNLISYIPQQHNINFHISVLDIVLMGFAPQMSLFESYNKKHRQLALNALEMVEMQNAHNKDFLQLAGGQNQVVILAGAVLQTINLMLFDEPDSAMDFNNKHLILEKIRRNITRQKCGIICLHDANYALKYCTRALIIKKGEIVCDLNLQTANKSEIKKAMCTIYTNIDVVDINGEIIIIKAP